MRKMLDEKLARFELLEKQLGDPSVLSDSNRMAAVAREHGGLTRLASKYRRFLEISNEIESSQEMIDGDDEELAELAEAELPELKQKREKLWQELLDLTIGGEDANRTRCVMEIRSGTGGDEAALFAGDLFQMYKRHAEIKGWKTEIMSASPTELGGFKEIIVAFEGEGVYRELQYESGGHRVQRVPETEAKGRIHTSAATVAVMPEPEDVDVDLKPDDYRVDKFNASGPGGQHVNKTESAIRLTHFETGIVVQCQDEKSQHKNLAKALRELRARIYDHKRQEELQKRADTRKTLIGSGDRSQRIRTYNFPENRITDHRINFTLYKLDQVLTGALQPVTDALIEFDRQQLRSSMGALD
ncbi:MAG: peptide chain release factor 1 [Planctomycetales bacterium]|nr:peptide chain release factor 1 [Planctomycetales bacterium]